MQYQFFANCPRHVEGLLLAEIQSLGATSAKETVTGVYFEGTLETAYRVCLWSRLANRVLLPLATIDALDIGSIHRGVDSINWASHFTPSNTFRIDFSGQSTLIHQSQYGAQLVKDAIVDQFRDKTGRRPTVETIHPDIRIHAHLYGDKLNISLDLSGESLHKRGYRLSTGDAPIKENLAAALLIRAGFPARMNDLTYVIDPMCGTGTLLIEAALIATDCAPGLLRKQFGFSHWLQHQPALWEPLVEEAKQRRAQGNAKKLPDFRGYDASPRAVSQARENVGNAGLTNCIEITVRELSQLTPPTHHGDKPGFLITNAPYGERLGDEDLLKPLYQHFGERLREKFIGWDVALFTGNINLGKALGIRAKKNYTFLNGTIPCKLLMISVEPEWFMREHKALEALEALDKSETSLAPTIQQEIPAEAEMFANRLRKNAKTLASWAKKHDVSCYRLYDADMPEYAVAIDYYEGYAHVQEYAAPKTIDADKAAQRLKAICQAIPAVLDIPADHVIVKQRFQQKDFSQYQRLDNTNECITVKEGAGKFLVNLHDYLDTGLFLDHRPIRLHLASIAKGKSFLNLYCYTGSATVHAALGGARNSVSVDMSATYTTWAKRNLSLNGLSTSLHQVIQADCFRFLDENAQKFDLIFLDPPTFSRSKRMEDDFDIQRDHVVLIKKTLRHLERDGVLYFSTNFRKFKLSMDAFPNLLIRDITRQTIDKDFERDLKIHQCFEITFKA
ncbi:MAG: bifunctional 23S rRNA (guanine(2069)-N(7))-methyltransferase RlmK/23S rRNA (guanine(2445)-N(2))-methyltransferase RlmL [Gammaproteobacteria bacterium]